MSNTLKLNKFDLLFEKIPKDPEVWSQGDVLQWLDLIGMEQYSDNFTEMKVDGLIILELIESELLEELKITTKLHRKKILKAIELLQQYHAYLKESYDFGPNRFESFPEQKPSRVQPKPQNRRGITNDELTRAQESKRYNSENEQDGNTFVNPSLHHYPQPNLYHPSLTTENPFLNNRQNIPNNVFATEMPPARNGDARTPSNSNTQFSNPGLTAVNGHFGSLFFSQNNQTPINVSSYFANRNRDVTNLGVLWSGTNPNELDHLNRNDVIDNIRVNNPNLVRSQVITPVPNNTPGIKVSITINSIEGPNELTHIIDDSGTKIGRHSSNHIVIYDESVSRHHAEIFYNTSVKGFCLKDVGSTTGTFLKLVDPLELLLGMIIEVGSYQLIVTNIVIWPSTNAEENINNSYVEFTLYESPEETQERVFTLAPGSSIGRKNTNALCFADDLHMSNLHCKVNMVGESFLFEDMASTNGSWLRLSKEGEESYCVRLQDDTIFKIGNSAMYEVIASSGGQEGTQTGPVGQQPAEKGRERQESLCTICWDAERDCLIMPCKHNVSCTKCVKSVKNCPICRAVIVDIMKIYKA